MSISAMVTVLDHAPEHWPSGLRMVAVVLADHVDGDGYCWPSVGRLATRSGLSRRQVQKYLSQLEEENVISRHGRPGSSNYYRWSLWTTAPQSEGGASSTTWGGASSTTPPPASSTTWGVRHP